MSRATHGFSLVEALIALTMLAAGLLVMGSTLGVATRATRDSVDALVADHLIRHKLAELRSTPYASLASGSERVILSGLEYRRGWTVRRGDPSPGTTRLEVRVEWSDYAAPLTNALSEPVTGILSDPLGTVEDVLEGGGPTHVRAATTFRGER